MYQKLNSISGKCGEIIELVMSSEDMPQDDGALFKIRLSIEEVLENVVNYAYGTSDGWLCVETKRDNDVLTITLTDGGTPFDPLAKPDPDLSLSVEDRPIGGLGIFLCKQMMDSISYKYENGCNILTMTKIAN